MVIDGNTCPSGLLIAFFMGAGSKGLIPTIAIICWLIHYIHRTLIYPFRIKTKGKKMPLTIASMAIVFNSINGFLIGYYLGNNAYFEGGLYQHPITILGLILFILGMTLKLHTDTILIGLRTPGEKGYKIPFGTYFKWVSCPNMSGEIIQ